MFSSIKRIFKLGWKKFVREKGATLATIFVLFLVIGLVGSLFLFKDMGDFLIAAVEEKIDISIYFTENAQESDILDIRNQVLEFPEVKKVEYVSQDKALDQFVERHKDDFVLISSVQELGTNPFLASLNIQAWEPSQYKTVYAFLSGLEGQEIIEKIDYYERESVIEKICALSNTFSQAGFYLAVVLFTIAIIVTLNTVRLSIYNSKKEIEVQRLVGASNWFIRGSFLVQGMLCGIIASLVAFGCLALFSWFFTAQIKSLFLDFDLFALFLEKVWTLLFIQIIIGISLGFIASNIAVKKYLKS